MNMRDTRSVFVRVPLAIVLVLTWLWGMVDHADNAIQQRGAQDAISGAHHPRN